MRFQKKLRYIYYRAVRGHGKPREVALGMAIGAAISITPVLGHTPLAVALAALTGQSKLAAALGVWVNNPLTMPFLFGASYTAGALVMRAPLTPPGGFLHAATHVASLGKAIYLPMLVGSLILALPLGAAAYWLTYQAVVTYRLKKRERRASRLHRWHWTAERGWHRLAAVEGHDGERRAHG
ncbi:MAG: DUF2062 domain-containing protein [Deltaproteobacteria bacterium]|nr:DUF2062 domain-containing protein [Deltaproteobacteria bacterium]